MPNLPDYPPDAAICRLLAAGPLTTRAIADQISAPERTVRHRIRQLRLQGWLETDFYGAHQLIEPLPSPESPSAGDGGAIAAARQSSAPRRRRAPRWTWRHLPLLPPCRLWRLGSWHGGSSTSQPVNSHA